MEGEPVGTRTGPDEPDEETLRTWMQDQTEMRARIVHSLPEGKDITAMRYIGGTDISFFTSPRQGEVDEIHAVAGFAILDMATLEVVAFLHCMVTLEVPYKPGFLAYREAPPLLRLIERARTEHADIFPDVILVDGSGVLHPRGCGLACHIGVSTGVPTVGVCKQFLACGGHDRASVRALEDSVYDYSCRHAKGAEGDGRATTLLKLRALEDQELYGDEYYAASVRTGDPLSRNPVYVSVGSHISLDDAVSIVQRVSLHRIPEPIRVADKMTRAIVHEIRQRSGAQSGAM